METIRARCTFWRHKEAYGLPEEPFLTAQLTFIPREGEYISIWDDRELKKQVYKVVRVEHILDSEEDYYPQSCSIYTIPATDFNDAREEVAICTPGQRTPRQSAR